jgi:peptidoglycan hydrolase-like protein with peptidoglycan-binding domain
MSKPLRLAVALAGVAGGVASAQTGTGALPPPPPSSVTQPTTSVPPTPAPATPGLPSPSSSIGVLPSQQGLGAQVTNELRPSPSLNASQVSSVQAALAAGGLYRGPIDGTLSGSTRAAVRQFQEINRLPASGDLDAETLARLLLPGSTASNGTTSTAGNRANAEPFAITTTGSTTGTSPTTTSSSDASKPFPLSTPLNTSPTPPPGTLIQP